MAGGKLTPRQKMINMMYLVLTAMLALNVSAEVLDAFVKIQTGLEHNIQITSKKNDETIKAFESAVEKEGARAEQWRDKAVVLRDKTKEINDYIQNLKVELVKKADGKDTPAVIGESAIKADTIGAMDNKDAVNMVLLGTNKNGKAYDLLPKADKFREYLVGEVVGNTSAVETLLGLLDFSHPKKGATDSRDWQTFTFDNTPLISAVALLSKIQVDILNSESIVLDHYKSQIGKEDMKISSIEAAVSNPNGMILKGSRGEATVFLAAFDESIDATINYAGRTEKMIGGKTKIPFSGTSIGPASIRGSISYIDGKGEKQDRPFEIPYQIMEASMAVSATKMNVFYAGVDNPLEISVSGVNQSVVRASASGAQADFSSLGGGKYNIVPKQTGEILISVTAEINGEQKQMGTSKFRVKRIPDPIPVVHGISGRRVSASALSTAQGVSVKMPDGFDFDYKFAVKSFILEVSDGSELKSYTSNGAAFTSDQRAALQKAKKGNKVYIEEIKVRAPEGDRELPSGVSFIIN